MNTYLITLKNNNDLSNLINELNQYNVVKIFKSLGNVFSITLPPELAKELESDSRILSVELKASYNTMNVRPINNYDGNWGLDRIDQRYLPLDQQYTFDKTGYGVDIYIQDTGIYAEHLQFGNRVTHLHTIPGYSYTDDNGHGTHVAATAAGSTFGVAPLANLFNVRCFTSSGNASNIDLIEGFDVILTHHTTKTSGHPSVVNMSFTGNKSTAINNAVQTMINAGIVVCCAAGNYNQPATNFSPASLTTAITVAASGKTDNFASFSNSAVDSIILSGNNLSNYGSVVDIIAPGVDILSAGINHNQDTRTLSGTSMATPHVVGVCALYLEANPTATPAQVQQWLIENSTKDTIALTTEAYANGTPNRLLYSVFTSSVYTLEWKTPVGLLTTVDESKPMSFKLSATSTNTNGQTKAVTYSVSNGNLPSGLTLSSTGIISGVPDEVTSDTTSNFTVRATDGISTATRNFSIIVRNVNKAPIWLTESGNIGTFREGDIIGFQFDAFDADNDEVTYSLQVGAFPPGLMLSSSGFLSGKVGQALSTTIYSFTVRVSDTRSLYADRNFTITVESFYLPLTWRTDAGTIGVANENSVFNYQLVAESRDTLGTNKNITYSIKSGNLPAGLGLSSNGQINGTLSLVSQTTTYTFEVDAFDGTSHISRIFDITVIDINNVPLWVTPVGLIGTWNEGDAVSYQLQANDPDNESVVFSKISGELPPGLSISSSGLISGTIGVIKATQTFTFIARITDGKSSVDRRFEMLVNDINQEPIWITDLSQKYDGYDFIGLFAEGDSINFQFAGYDPENSELTYSVLNGLLPDGISLTSSGLLRGTIQPLVASSIEDTSNVENSPSGYYYNKRYRFVVGLSDGMNITEKKFQITVTDNPEGPLPVWLTSSNLGTFIESKPVFIQLKAIAFLVPNENIYFTEDPSAKLPEGLTLLTNGEIYGSVNSISTDTDFTFRVTANAIIQTVYSTASLPSVSTATSNNLFYVLVEDTNTYYYNDGQSWIALDISDFSTTKEFTLRIQNRQTLDIPYWVTDSGSLGDIFVYDKSLFELKAEDKAGSTIIYEVVDGELPPGLELQSIGIISGKVTSNAKTNRPYEFTVEARNSFNTSQQRTFSISVKRYYNDPDLNIDIVDVYIPITGDIRQAIHEEKFIPTSFLFRPTDQNFGRIIDKEIYVAGGLNFESLKNFYDTIGTAPSWHRQDWQNPNYNGLWFTPNLAYMHPTLDIGEYGWSTVHDSNGDVVYEVVWRHVIDPQQKAYKPGRVTDGKVEPGVVYPQSSNIGLPEAEYLEPQSIRNLRDELLDKFGLDKLPERIPEWVINASTSSDNLKWLIPIAYVLPGKGNDTVALLQSYNLLATPLRLDVDRWAVQYQNETEFENMDTRFDDINLTNDTTSIDWTTDHSSTRFDLDDKEKQFVKFYSDSMSALNIEIILYEDDGLIINSFEQTIDDGNITDNATIFVSDGGIYGDF